MNSAWVKLTRLFFAFFSVVLLTLNFSVGAVEPSRDIDEFAIDVWTTNEGLPHNQVQAMAQTPDGYIWFGTWQGLVRFNSIKFKMFNRENTPELRDNGIRSLLVDLAGTLWVGTARGGISRYFPDGHWDHLDEKQGLNSLEVLTMHEDRKGRIWVGFENAGLLIIEPSDSNRDINDRKTRLLQKDGLYHGTVLAFAEDQDGSMWIGTTAGINIVRDGKVERPELGPNNQFNPIIEIFVDRDGVVRVGTENGLFRVDKGLLNAELPLQKMLRQPIARIHQDQFGVLWMGTVSGGVLRLNNGLLENLNSATGLPHNRIITLFEDFERNIWMGTSAGLVRLKDAPFATYGLHRKLSDVYVRAVTQDRAGIVWAGTSSGLNRFQNGAFSRVPLGAADITRNSIMSLFPDTDGSLWVGTYDNGVAQLVDGIVVKNLTRTNGLAGSQVRAILRTIDETLWIGSTTGLSRQDKNGIKNYTGLDGLPRDYILSLYEARDHTLWIGTTGGFASFRNNQFTSFSAINGYPVADVFGFHQSSDGTLWLATSDGIGRFSDNKFILLDAKYGALPSPAFSLIEDEDQFFWLSSNAGVYRIEKAQLDQAAFGTRKIVDSRQFGRDDGLATSQCNGGSQSAAWRTVDGRIWFATARGLAFVKPRNIVVPNLAPPTVQIEQIILNGSAVSNTAAVMLQPGNNRVEFEFAALSYRSPSTTRYRYQLAGVDPNWIENPGARSVSYTNLVPRNYQFKVQAAHLSGDWGAIKSVQVNQHAYFYQTNSFRILLGICLLSVALAFGWWRARQLKKRETQLTQLVQERTRALELRQVELEKANEEKLQLIRKIQDQSGAFAKMAREDALTGLPNRREFERIAATMLQECRTNQKPCIAGIADLDQFKLINDRYSHAAGDEVLRTVAQIMREHIGLHGIVARYGGEEFVMMFPNLDLKAAHAICERIRSAIESFGFNEITPGLTVTLSIGLADKPETQNFERLITDADQQLYRAKNSGRNRICF